LDILYWSRGATTKDIVVQPPESDDFIRVQVKTARPKNGGDEKLKFNTRSANPHSSSWDGVYTSEDIDVFAVYFPDKDDYFGVPVEECGDRKILSYVETDRPELEGRLNMAEDYKL